MQLPLIQELLDPVGLFIRHHGEGEILRIEDFHN